jgi:subtilisin-like proprotein convertase family protein
MSTIAAPSSFGWHLRASTGGTVGIGAEKVWPDYTGNGVRVGVYDDGIDTGGAAATFGKHGTAVAGIIAGRATSGAPGVAFEATLVDRPVIGLSLTQIATQLQSQTQFDIVNHSWGWGAAFYADASDSRFSALLATFAEAAEKGRGGLGTLINIAAGNFKVEGVDANASNLSNERHAIVVAAVTSEGTATSYSSQGASIWIAAPSAGGSRGGILTTDKPGASGYSTGDTTNTFGGTSAATPQASGVEALILDANPTLGWRDVKAILALSAQPSNVGAPTMNGASMLNGGGLRFSNDTGFGLLDARAAVRLAETWMATSTSANEVSVSGGANLGSPASIPDQSTRSFTIELSGGVSVETVQLSFDGLHGRASDLVIELVSPTGMVSRLLQGKNGDAVLNDWTFTSNAFFGEASGGNWTVRVTDKTSGVTGTVNNLSLTAFGGAATVDSTYVFTDAFSRGGSAPYILTDGIGNDIINASTVTSNVTIDLRDGASSTIAGRTLTLSKGTVVETAFAGDGNDLLTASDTGSTLWGGRGDDTLKGGAGADILLAGSGNNVVDGGGGKDTMRLDGVYKEWTVSAATGKVDLAAFTAAAKNSVTNVERFVFDDYTLAFDVQGTAGQGYRLFEAAFDRAPDLKGLAFWISKLDAGVGLRQIAEGFLNSSEFKTIYANTTSNDAYVQALYNNVQGRAPDAAGLAYWTEKLASGAMDKVDVLVQFSESAENVAQIISPFQKGILLDNSYLLV